MMYLSKHFTLTEAMKSQQALRFGIDNTPPDSLIPNLTRTANQILEPVREHYGVPFSPSSWYRSRQLNIVAGGSKTSQHMSGCAVDFEVSVVDNETLARWVFENCNPDQVILEYYHKDDKHSGWVHASWAEVPRGEFLIFDGKKYERIE